MSKLDRLYESKFMKGLQKFGNKIAANKAFSSISKSFLGMMGIIMIGAVFQIIAAVPSSFGAWTTDSAIYKILMVPYNMTMGIISVYFVFSLAYNYSKALGLKPLLNGVSSTAIFLMVCAPATLYTLADGKSTITALSISYLGGQGLFVAILIGLLTVRMTNLCERKKIYIKMPDAVPQFLTESFAVIVPMLFNVIIWYGISAVLSILTKGAMSLPVLITYILSVPFNAMGNSIIGIIILCLFGTLCWTFGIHGTMVASMVIYVPLFQAMGQNAQLVAAGQAPVFAPVMLFSIMSCAGGAGNTLALCVMGLKSKSKQIQAVSRAAIIPGIFKINEPATFGFPIMYNPILAVPYMLNVVISMLLVWVGYLIGFFKPAYILIMSLMPIGVGEFMGTLAWQNIFIPVLVFIVAFVCYFPFFKVYERQLIEKEAAAEAETATEVSDAQPVVEEAK